MPAPTLIHYLSRSIPEIHYACCWGFGQPRNQTDPESAGPCPGYRAAADRNQTDPESAGPCPGYRADADKNQTDPETAGPCPAHRAAADRHLPRAPPEDRKQSPYVPQRDHPGGPAVRRPSESGRPGTEPLLPAERFFPRRVVTVTSNLNGILVDTLQGAWRYRVTTRTGWSSVSIS